MTRNLTRSKILATATEFVEAHFALDNIKVAAFLADGCTHGGGPDLLKMPTRNNKEYLEFNDAHFPIFAWYKGEITDSYVDVEQRTTIFYIHSTAEISGLPYDCTYVVKVAVDQDGEKVVENHQFIDSFTMIEFQKKIEGFKDEVWEKK